MREIVLQTVPLGVPVPDDFCVRESTAIDSVPTGQLLCRSVLFSLDPYLRGILSGRHLGHRCLPGELIPGEVLAEVESSGDPSFGPGDLITAHAGWKERFSVATDQVVRLDSQIFPKLAPASASLGMLGMPGLTAWAGIRKLAHVKSGDRVVISAAAGAVGSTASQIARCLGAEVLGIAGGEVKCHTVQQRLGIPCLDYKHSDFPGQLRAACPKGIDVYFDNVGGELLNTALLNLAIGARVVLCGLIDQYNKHERPSGPNLGPVIAARAHLMGLVVYDHFFDRERFLNEMRTWLESSQLTPLEDLSHGFEHLPAAFCRLMRGENIGKTLLAV